jgi:antitoxin CptB
MAASYDDKGVARMAASYDDKGVTCMAASYSVVSQLRWQCRRGMRELDELLSAYLEREYSAADGGEKAAFQALLELPDPDLASYLLQQRTSPPGLAVVIERILKRADA